MQRQTGTPNRVRLGNRFPAWIRDLIRGEERGEEGTGEGMGEGEGREGVTCNASSARVAFPLCRSASMLWPFMYVILVLMRPVDYIMCDNNSDSIMY